jgi:RimJ/RimL family protein N-acetyltransferase
MVYAEEEARRRGLDRVGLMVFGGNEVARNLYRSLGYAEIAVFVQATPSSRPDSLSSSARGIHRLTTEERLPPSSIGVLIRRAGRPRARL